MTLYIYDFLKVGLLQRTPNLLESISTQNPLFWVVPTVHTQRFRELCQKSSVEKMLCFLCCSRVVSDMAEVRFMWIFHEVGRNFISIVAVFFSLFSKTEDKTGVEPVQTSLSFVIRYSLYVSLITSAKTADTKHHVTPHSDLHGNSERQTYNFQTQTYLQLTNTCLLHHAIHVGVAAFPRGSRLRHRFYKQSWTACGCRCLGNQDGEAPIRAAKQSGWFGGSFADMGYMISCWMMCVSACFSFWSWHMLSNTLGVNLMIQILGSSCDNDFLAHPTS